MQLNNVTDPVGSDAVFCSDPDEPGRGVVARRCDYAAEGKVEHIRLLVTNKVDVSLGDYDDRTPLHLAACNGNTAVLEYLLQQDSVLLNAVDRFGGTPYQDAVRHGRKGAAGEG